MTNEQYAVLAASMLLAPADAAAPAEGCEHLLQVRWKENRAICCVCRSVIEGPCQFGLRIEEPRGGHELTATTNHGEPSCPTGSTSAKS